MALLGSWEVDSPPCLLAAIGLQAMSQHLGAFNSDSPGAIPGGGLHSRPTLKPWQGFTPSCCPNSSRPDPQGGCPSLDFGELGSLGFRLRSGVVLGNLPFKYVLPTWASSKHTWRNQTKIKYPSRVFWNPAKSS